MELTISSTVTLNNGVKMPLFGLGTFRIPGASMRAAVHAALALGYRLFDTASAYGNEEDLGAALADMPVDRRELFITTKVWTTEQGYRETLTACRNSLAALRLEYLDLYLIHWPAPGHWQESWRVMIELQEQGVCRAIGVSNFTIRHLEELRNRFAVLPAVNQVEFSPFLFRRGLLDYCFAHGIQPESYSPLTRGIKFDNPVLRAIADKYGKSPAQILIRWTLQHRVVIIPKSANPQHIRENADVFDFEIDEDDIAALDGLNEEFSIVNREWREQFE